MSLKSENSILFLEKTFLYDDPGLIGGVELFNINLIREMTECGCRFVVLANRKWGDSIRKSLGQSAVEIVDLLPGLDTVTKGLSMIWRFRNRRFKLLLVGNTGNRLIPLVWLLKKLRMVEHYVAILHREPAPQFVHALKHLPIDILAVNGKIASHFDKAVFTKVRVGYGIMHHDQYFPAPAAYVEKQYVDFCVVGHLDRKWKGADTAISAFKKIPAELQAKCRLHLLGYTNPPSSPEANIVIYDWKDRNEVAPFLRQMDVMIVPSRDEKVMRETFSQTAVQGMLSGLPLIVSDLPILEEKIDRGGGLVFHDEAELTRAMEKLVTEPEFRRTQGELGRQTALARYVWDTKAFVKEHIAPFLVD